MRVVPETYNRQDWPRLVAQKVNSLGAAVGGTAHRNATGNTTVTATDRLVTVDATAGPVTVTLPSLQPIVFTVKKIDATANTVTISGAANIDGSASAVLNTPYESLTLGGGTEWHIL